MSPESFERFKTKKFFIDEPDMEVEKAIPSGFAERTADNEGTPKPAPTAVAESTGDAEAMELDTSPISNRVNTEATNPESAPAGKAPPPENPNPIYNPNGVQYDPSKPITPPSQPTIDAPAPVQATDLGLRRREITPPAEPSYARGSTPERFRETSPFLNPIEDEELPPGTIIHYHQRDGTIAKATQSTVVSPVATTNGKFPAATNASIPVVPAEEEEHHWPRNPMSVYCWLRKYQPQVFLQDNEAPGGKERKKKGKGRGAAHEDDDDEHNLNSPADGKPRRGGTRISLSGGLLAREGEVAEGKTTVGQKRRRPAKDDGTGDTPEKEKEKGGGKGRGNSTPKAPAAKRPRKSGVKKERDDD